MSFDTQSIVELSNRSPSPDQETALDVLGYLAGLRPAAGFVTNGSCNHEHLAGWLVENDLAPLAQARFRGVCPDLSARLQTDVYTTAAQNVLHWRNLQKIDGQLEMIGSQAVLLKGAALAQTVYDSPEQRPMVDVDLWLQKQDVAGVCIVMQELGFSGLENAERPLMLQALADGEIQYLSDDQPPTLVELHLSPFAGWWLQRTAVIDNHGIWMRKRSLDGWQSFYQLAAEDMVIHIAVHLAVNHQFGLLPLRSLIDIALVEQAGGIDWQVLVDRAGKWHVATAVWLVLYYVQQLIGTLGLDEVLAQLQPSAWHRRQLLGVVTPESVLAGQDIREERERYRFLLLLVDRPQDAGKLVYRTLWPEEAWLNARYGGDINNWQHFHRILTRRDI